MSEGALRDLFERAAEMATEERTVFLAQACGGDAALRSEVEALLAADADAANETFWQHSALRHEVIANGGARSAVGETIGHYRLVELIGRGGMGTVYRAERMDAEFDKCVAVKLIDGLFHSADVIAYFRAERQILANLEHPNIARLLDGGTRVDGLPYLIMEYIEGTSPYDYCREHNLSTAERLALFRQICSAVHFAHQHMVIHRDLKPANILVTAEGSPKLLDFGIAKVLNPDSLRSNDARTEPGMLRLTARYASPEQILGEPVTTASDVYSLGVILYELLTGHSPYGDVTRSTHQIMSAVCDEAVARPSVRTKKLKGDVDNIVLKALRKPPLQRYASADQFSEDILRYLEGRPVQARGDAPLYVAAKFVRRNWAVVTAACLLLASLIGGLIEVNLARERANRRFNQVRQLAHSVMFDYADAIDRLPGATPVRARLVKDALTYLDSLEREADTPQLQREIVDAYVRVSNVQGNEYENNMGDTAASLASAQKAAAAAEKLLRKDRALPALNSAADAFSTEGSLLYSTGDLHGAEAAYQRAVSLRRDIAQRSPADMQNRIALATCMNHLGDLYGGIGFSNLGKTTESIAWYEQAKGIVQALSAQSSGNVEVEKEGYETLLSLSSAENTVGRRDEAVRDLSNALAQIEKVSAAEPRDTNVTMELANAESRIGQLLLDDRNPGDAAGHLSRSSTLLQGLSQADPGNAMFRRGTEIVEQQLAAALRGEGQFQAAVEHNRNALKLAETLSGDATGSAGYRADIGVSQRKLSESLLAAGDAKGALHAAEQAFKTLCGKASEAGDAHVLTNCGRAHLAEGNAYLALHDAKAAASALQTAVTIASEQLKSDPQNAVLRSDTARSETALAAALAQAGDTPSALSMGKAAMENWSALRESKSITPEDSHRAEDAAAAFAKLPSRPSPSHR